MSGALEVQGAWETEAYVVAGASTPVDGVLLLTSGRWATLYFVPGDAGPWGSAESGTYDVDGDRLTFRHRLVFQGGGGRPLEIDQRADRIEVCEISEQEARLSIRFPSGNVLHLRRVVR